jgi:hypothetical protein
MAQDYPEEFLTKLRAVTAMRPKRVIEHILEHGHITTQELNSQYGYNHPPRAARDVRELGIPLETFKVTGSDGRKIAAYRFADPAAVRGTIHTGRIKLPKRFKRQFIERYGTKCALCSGEFEASFLQIDHRIPYEVGGQAAGDPDPDHYMLVCRTCNRGKSWSCEHCENWLRKKNADICRTCYWASPDEYSHIAMKQLRRLALTWSGKETTEYDRLAAKALDRETDLPEFVKAILRKHLKAP